MAEIEEISLLEAMMNGHNFTYGGNIGCHVIIKDEWAMHDTFVNMEELESMSMFEAMLDGHKGLIRALIREEIIENPFEDY